MVEIDLMHALRKITMYDRCGAMLRLSNLCFPFPILLEACNRRHYHYLYAPYSTQVNTPQVTQYQHFNISSWASTTLGRPCSIPAVACSVALDLNLSDLRFGLMFELKNIITDRVW